MHPVYFSNDSTPEEETGHVESSAFMFYGSLFGPAIDLSVEFACSNHNDMVAEPPLQIEGNSAIFNWFGDHTIIHDQSKYICKTCYLQLYKTYSQGSEKSSPQGYKITFEILSQKIVSGNEESFIKYFGNKSAVNKKSLLTESDEAGLALLHYSVLAKENSQITKYLIEEGARVDTKDHCGVSPLHWACWNADVDTIEILLDNQCNVFSRDVTGRLPLHYLCLSQNTKTKEQSMKLLSEYRGFSECSTVQDLAGCTPLHYATLSRSYPCVSLLLSHGSDPNCSATTTLTISTSPASLSPYSGDCRLVSLFKPRDKVMAALVGGGDVSNLKGRELHNKPKLQALLHTYRKTWKRFYLTVDCQGYEIRII
ncbi:serine/threonine-protein phosphatase 6 regulatory ankyrin repeat subunit B-like [Bolinopsis microptera]|uniref:serine/threonine-protein phosphatase 6 regulatory ankyrin repeat subunit B-like n=1 Tax=Bolinopsis microptera TaxID=2820187 RepID=UPI003079CFA1